MRSNLVFILNDVYVSIILYGLWRGVSDSRRIEVAPADGCLVAYRKQLEIDWE